MRSAVTIDHSPPGAWRAAIERAANRPARCAKCGQSICGHPDAEYRGEVPAEVERK